MLEAPVDHRCVEPAEVCTFGDCLILTLLMSRIGGLAILPMVGW